MAVKVQSRPSRSSKRKFNPAQGTLFETNTDTEDSLQSVIPGPAGPTAVEENVNLNTETRRSPAETEACAANLLKALQLNTEANRLLASSRGALSDFQAEGLASPGAEERRAAKKAQWEAYGGANIKRLQIENSGELPTACAGCLGKNCVELFKDAPSLHKIAESLGRSGKDSNNRRPSEIAIAVLNGQEIGDSSREALENGLKNVAKNASTSPVKYRPEEQTR